MEGASEERGDDESARREDQVYWHYLVGGSWTRAAEALVQASEASLAPALVERAVQDARIRWLAYREKTSALLETIEESDRVVALALQLPDADEDGAEVELKRRQLARFAVADDVDLAWRENADDALRLVGVWAERAPADGTPAA